MPSPPSYVTPFRLITAPRVRGSRRAHVLVLLLLSACLLGLSRPASARFSPPTGTPVLAATQGDTSVTLS